MISRFVRKVCFVFICTLCVAPAMSVFAQNNDIAGSAVFGVAKDSPFKFYTFTFKNDAFVNDDDGFTSGIGLTYGKGPFLSFDGQIPGLLNGLTKNLYIQNRPNKVHGVAYMLFQTLQTPEDITIAEFQPDDLPYAGLLVLQMQLYSWDKNVSDQLSLFLGLVGPAALGEEAQTNIHRALGAAGPEGWDFQLENEPVFRLETRRVQKFYRRYGTRLGFDVLGLATGGFGNLRSDIKVGVALRWGSSLEYSHATFSLQSDRQVNSLSLSDRNDFFFYLGARAGYVFNDILVDGNTFEDSLTPDLANVQDEISGGIVLNYGRLAYVFQLTSSSPSSEKNNDRESFGALSITYPFR